MTDPIEHLQCDRCRLADYRTQVVPGRGDLDATLALVGEAPGQVEDTEGQCWVGKAGQLLDTLVECANLSSIPTWRTNVVHCRPPRNDLSAFPDALDTCPSLWLRGEGGELVSLPNLRVIVALGQTAGALWFAGKKAHELEHLQTFTTIGQRGGIVVVGAYHPSFALRQGTHIEDSIVASLTRARRYLE